MDKDKLAAVLDDIFDNFDFERVKKTMDALGWQWAYAKGENGVPTLDEIKQAAANLLWDLATDPDPEITIHAIGGFRAERDFSDPENPWMRLSFEITDWDACPYQTDDDI